MKRVILVLISSTLTSNLSAQTFQEWFNQKQTQIKYLIEQIVAVGTYAGGVKKGYEITKNGLRNIKDLKQGDFDIHSHQFNSLSDVSPSVQNYSKVLEIIALQKGILQMTFLSKQTSKNTMLTSGESRHINAVYENILSESLNDINQLVLCLSNGELQLNEGSRIKRIDLLHQEIQEKYVFSQGYLNSLKLLISQRSRELDETKALSQIHGIK